MIESNRRFSVKFCGIHSKLIRAMKGTDVVVIDFKFLNKINLQEEYDKDVAGIRIYLICILIK
jgi:hypothetical protein